MPRPGSLRPRDRLVALAAVAAIQLGLAAALLSGLRVDMLRPAELVSKLIVVTLPPVPPPVPQVSPTLRSERRHSPAPRGPQAPAGGSAGANPSDSSQVPAAAIVLRPSSVAPGGGTGSGPAFGSGRAGGSGGVGYGDADEGGSDLVQIAGAILPSDYPNDMRDRGIGGRVEVLFTVATDGRVASCSVTRSSGVVELDMLTCRLIQQRFRYRPSTDRYGRAVPDVVEGRHDWVAR